MSVLSWNKPPGGAGSVAPTRSGMGLLAVPCPHRATLCAGDTLSWEGGSHGAGAAFGMVLGGCGGAQTHRLGVGTSSPSLWRGLGNVPSTPAVSPAPKPAQASAELGDPLAPSSPRSHQEHPHGTRHRKPLSQGPLSHPSPSNRSLRAGRRALSPRGVAKGVTAPLPAVLRG